MQTLADKILDALKKYHKVFKEQTLTTLEEIEATEGSTSGGGYWPSASAVAELNNKLMSRPEWITDENGKITGYKTQGGADTVFPFSYGKVNGSANLYGKNGPRSITVKFEGYTKLSYNGQSATVQLDNVPIPTSATNKIISDNEHTLTFTAGTGVDTNVSYNVSK